MKWLVYIVKCSDNSLYTGITNNLPRRVWLHNNKLGAKSLRGKVPVKLVFKEIYKDQKDAAKREREIKSWSRKKKIELIAGGAEEGFTLSKPSLRRAASSTVEQLPLKQ
ncbi:MAG: GIY-YIG nuclease family protein [Candidatus Pacebacteria bacterium]|nr:GIY-YIG nuclease family protein [Candidatus Paceibacterota bacterium]